MATDFDISTINSWRHHDAAFVVLLAYACGWTIHPNSSGSLRMFSQDGTQVTVPDNTSLNINVFRSWVGKVWRHRRTTVSPKAFEELVGKSKIDRPHVKIAWTATALEPPTPLPETTAHDDDQAAAEIIAATLDERDDAAHRQAADAVAALVDGPAEESWVKGEAKALEVLERTMYPPADGNRHGKIRKQGLNRYRKNSKYGGEHVSEHVVRREWSDGFIDFACADCGHVSKSPSGIGGHRVTHGDPAAKAAKGIQTKRRKAALAAQEQARIDEKAAKAERVEAAAETDDPILPPPPALAVEAPEVRLAQIARLVFPSMQQRVEALMAERDAAIARAEKAEGDLDALRDLLGARK